MSSVNGVSMTVMTSFGLVSEVFVVNQAQVVHFPLELLVEAWLEWVDGDLVWDEAKVEHEHDHVGLLGVVVLIVVVVLDLGLSVWLTVVNVVHSSHVLSVGNDVVEGSALDWSQGDLGVVKLVGNMGSQDLDSVVVEVVVVLVDHVVAVLELESLEELGQVFVNLEVDGAHGHSPFLQIIGEIELQNGNNNRKQHHDEERGGLVDTHAVTDSVA